MWQNQQMGSIDKEYVVAAHKVNSQSKFFLMMMMGQVTLSPDKLSDWPEISSTSCNRLDIFTVQCCFSLRDAHHSTRSAFLTDLLVFPVVCHLSLLTTKRVNLVVACDGFLSQYKLSASFLVVTLITKELFEKLMIVQWIKHGWKQSIMDTSVFRW